LKSFRSVHGILILSVASNSTYLAAMSQTLEQRVENLEKEFSELRAWVLNMRRPRKDWRSTFGTLEDDEITKEAERLGREYRQQQTCQKEIAGS
jgi:hypothetical protein